MIRRLLLALATLCLPGFAEAQTPADGKAVVDARAQAFFRALQREDAALEYSFLARDLAAQVSPSDWKGLRQSALVATGGVLAYVPWNTTFYMQGSLLAAVDFSARAKVADTHVCGFVLWQFSDEGLPMVIRLEENVVPVAAMKAMPLQEAAQTMVDFRCPKSLIEQTLGVQLR